MQELIEKAKQRNESVKSVHFDHFLNQIDLENPKAVIKSGFGPMFGEEADLIDALIEIAAHNAEEAALLLG